MVIAAGNAAYDMDLNPSHSFPCSFSLNEPDNTRSPTNVMCVAATTHTCCSSGASLAYFSNYGISTVDIAAPGTDILSTVPASSRMTQFLSELQVIPEEVQERNPNPDISQENEVIREDDPIVPDATGGNAETPTIPDGSTGAG